MEISLSILWNQSENCSVAEMKSNHFNQTYAAIGKSVNVLNFGQNNL